MNLQFVFGNPVKGTRVAKGRKARENGKQRRAGVKTKRYKKKNPFTVVARAPKRVKGKVVGYSRLKRLGVARTKDEIAAFKSRARNLKKLLKRVRPGHIDPKDLAKYQSQLKDAEGTVRFSVAERKKLLALKAQAKKMGMKVSSTKVSDKEGDKLLRAHQDRQIAKRKAEKKAAEGGSVAKKKSKKKAKKKTYKKAGKKAAKKSTAKKPSRKKAGKKSGKKAGKKSSKKASKKSTKKAGKKHSRKKAGKKAGKKSSRKKAGKKAGKKSSPKKAPKKAKRRSKKRQYLKVSVAGMKKGAVKVSKRRKGKRKYANISVRTNPFGGMMKPNLNAVKNFLVAGDANEAAYLAAAAALSRPLSAGLMKVPGVGAALGKVDAILAKVSPKAADAITPVLPSIAVAALLEVAGKKSPHAKKLSRALMAANIVSIGAAVGETIASVTGLKGVDYTPVSGMRGVDYTPVGAIPHMSGAGDFGGPGDFGSAGADFGGVDYTPVSGAHDMDADAEGEDQETGDHTG